MSYLPHLGLKSPNYDRFPTVAIRGHSGQSWRGWEAIGAQIKAEIQARTQSSIVIAIECYDGVLDDEIIPALARQLTGANFFLTKREVFLTPQEIEARLSVNLGQADSIFGYLSPIEIKDYLDCEKCAGLKEKIRNASGVSIVYGTGALLCCDPDRVCSDFSANSWRIVDPDYRDSLYVVPDKGQKIWHGYDDGDFKWLVNGADWYGLLGCTAWHRFWVAWRFDFEIRRLSKCEEELDWICCIQSVDDRDLYPHVLYGGRFLGKLCSQFWRGICR